MATEVGKKSVEITEVERTWRVELFCEYGSTYSLRAHREIIGIDQDGNLVSQNKSLPVIERSFDRIAEQDFMGVSGLQMAEMISAACDKFKAENIEAEAAEAARKAAEEAEATAREKTDDKQGE